MTDHFIQQQIAEFALKYPSTAPKKEIATETPKVAQSATPAPVPKKSGNSIAMYKFSKQRF
jgi:hypothetical protein